MRPVCEEFSPTRHSGRRHKPIQLNTIIMHSKSVAGARFEVIRKKVFYFIEEIKALKGAGILYSVGFGILIVLLFPALILELVVLLVSGTDLRWFQSSEYIDKRIVLRSDDAQKSPRDLISPVRKSAIGIASDRDEPTDPIILRELDKPDQREGLKMEGHLFLENYAGQSVDELIGLQNTHRIDSIVLAFESALDVRRENGEELTAVELTILAVESFEREVNNGGFEQFFYNSSVQYTPIIVASLNNIGCHEMAKLAQRAIHILAVDSLDPDTIEERMDPDDEELSEALGKLDDIFFESEEVPGYALLEYIGSNRDSIKLA